MKSRFVISIIIIFFLLSLYAEKIVILHTNDHHGRPLSFQVGQFTGGGLPVRATVIDSIRNINENVLLLDCGDINDGLIESNLFDAEPDIKGYNYLKYDAMTLGNHEFYESLEKLNKQKKNADFPFLCANITYNDGSYVAKPYIIKEIKNKKIGIIGLTTNTTQFSAPISVTSHLKFLDEVETAQGIVNNIKDSTDMIIALVHLGISEDPEYGSLRLAKHVKGIDIVIDGHSHTQLEKPVWVKQNASQDSIPVVQALCWGTFIGKAEFEVNQDKVDFLSWTPIALQTKDKDRLILTEKKELLDLLQSYQNVALKQMGKVIGQADKDYNTDKVRWQENELASLCVDAMQWYFRIEKPDFSITNGGGVRNFLNKGDIKKSDIHNLLPFDNHVVLLEITGADLLTACEHLVKHKIGTGGFLHFSKGFKIEVNPDSTLKMVTFHKKAIRPDAIYRVLTNSYLANGGDAFESFRNAKVMPIETVFQRDIVISYIENKLKGKIKLSSEPQIFRMEQKK